MEERRYRNNCSDHSRAADLFDLPARAATTRAGAAAPAPARAAPRSTTLPVVRRLAAALALLVVLALAAAIARAASQSGRVYRNPDCRVELLELPRGWDLTPPWQIGYPRVLVIGTTGSARLVFAVQRIVAGTSAVEVAAAARALLIRQGWRDPRVTPDGERAFLDAGVADSKRLLHQVYVVDGDLAFVLTSVAPPERNDRVLRDFDATLRSLEVIPLGVPEDGRPAETSPRCR
jgi:hypothetical protein